MQEIYKGLDGQSRGIYDQAQMKTSMTVSKYPKAENLKATQLCSSMF
jgi:hypothetical protein